MSDSHAVDLSKKRSRPSRLIYLDNVARPYGINEQDIWNMDGHMAAVFANGLRMLAAYGHAVIDKDEYELIASKFEFYAMDHGSVLHENIDWSNDPDQDTEDLLDWVNANDRSRWPGMNEYAEKSDAIDIMKQVYIQEALEWIAKHWRELWD